MFDMRYNMNEKEQKYDYCGITEFEKILREKDLK